MIKYSVKQDGRRGLYRGTTILVITTSRGMVMHSFRKAIIARTASESKGNFFCCWSVPLYRTLKIWYLVHYPCCLVVRLFIRHISIGVVPKEHFHICSQVQATTIPDFYVPGVLFPVLIRTWMLKYVRLFFYDHFVSPIYDIAALRFWSRR